MGCSSARRVPFSEPAASSSSVQRPGMSVNNLQWLQNSSSSRVLKPVLHVLARTSSGTVLCCPRTPTPASSAPFLLPSAGVPAVSKIHRLAEDSWELQVAAPLLNPQHTGTRISLSGGPRTGHTSPQAAFWFFASAEMPKLTEGCVCHRRALNKNSACRDVLYLLFACITYFYSQC